MTESTSGEIRIVPRYPTDREIDEILYNINRKRSVEHGVLTK